MIGYDIDANSNQSVLKYGFNTVIQLNGYIVICHADTDSSGNACFYTGSIYAIFNSIAYI